MTRGCGDARDARFVLSRHEVESAPSEQGVNIAVRACAQTLCRRSTGGLAVRCHGCLTCDAPTMCNVAVQVNRWYDPVYTKDFPCAECPMTFNADKYGHLSAGMAAASGALSVLA